MRDIKPVIERATEIPVWVGRLATMLPAFVVVALGTRVKIGEGFGVPSISVDTAEALARELEKALMQKGPRLIEAIMA